MVLEFWGSRGPGGSDRGCMGEADDWANKELRP